MNEEEISDLKDTYREVKKKSPKERVIFLQGIAYYCKYLDLSLDESLHFLGIIRNCEPYNDQEWKDCDPYDEIDIEFNNKLISEFKNPKEEKNG
jgi:hypothetical protein